MNESINSECSGCMIPHLNIFNIFTRSHPSKGENQKEICKPKQVLKFGCLSPGSHQSLLVICNTTYNLLFPLGLSLHHSPSGSRKSLSINFSRKFRALFPVLNFLALPFSLLRMSSKILPSCESMRRNGNSSSTDSR